MMFSRQTNWQIHFTAILVASLFLSLSTGHAESLAQKAEKEFLTTRVRFQKNQADFESAWHFGRACFDWAEFARDNDEREEIAEQGIAACKSAISQKRNGVEGHYYLAMNLGQLARTKTLGALRLVDEMEEEFKTAAQIDEKFDFAGPDRNLGLLYHEAPGWPTSIGSRSKARHHLQRAVELNPNYPENYLNLIEASLKWGDKNGALREFKKLKQIWPAAKKEFAAEKWESSWSDWEKRFAKIEGKLEEPSRLLAAPHNEN